MSLCSLRTLPNQTRLLLVRSLTTVPNPITVRNAVPSHLRRTMSSRLSTLTAPKHVFSTPSSSPSPVPSDPTHLPDAIVVSQLAVRMLVGVDNWERVQPQPVTIDVRVHTDVTLAGGSDHLPYSIHYGVLVKALERHCAENRYRSLEALADGLAKVCIFICHAPRVTLRVQKPRSLLHAHSAGVEVVRTAADFVGPNGASWEATLRSGSSDDGVEGAPPTPASSTLALLRLSPLSDWATHDKVIVRDLLLTTILGVNPWERIDKQVVKLNLVVYSGLERLRQAQRPAVDVVDRPHNYRTIVRSITEYVEGTSYKTVESLATSIARVAVSQNRVERIRVRVDKPSAIMYAESAGVEVERDRAFFELEATQDGGRSVDPKEESATTTKGPISPPAAVANRPNQPSLPASDTAAPSSSSWHLAAIALGSNLGDRAHNIERAIQALANAEDCKLVDTSFLYETEPMYVSDQPKFLNGACRIATRLSPEALLDLTQSIEASLGRPTDHSPTKGPRTVDLDLLFYDRVEMQTPRLTLPHPGIAEREFVLLPLADVLPNFEHPGKLRTVEQLLGALINSPDYVPSGIYRVMPLSESEQSDAAMWAWGKRTLVMGILNATPDSFSDGGDHLFIIDGVERGLAMVANGADVLDVGGQSTAPGAPEVMAEEEINRVVPLVRSLRDAGVRVPISVDTYRASVANLALSAGANIVNDVSGGTRDRDMLPTVARWGCPIILMHMRGNSATMKSLATYEGGAVLPAVRAELEQRVDAALRAGVRRWNIIADPGIGFAKDEGGNLAILRDLATLTNSSVGASRVGPSASSSARVASRRTSMQSLRRGAADSSQPTGSASSQGRSEEDDPSLSSLTTPNSSLHALPLLIGASRKKFLGTLTARPARSYVPSLDPEAADALVVPRPPKERLFATAAACTAAVAGGADMLRVHDVEEMVDVVRVADAIWRRGG